MRVIAGTSKGVRLAAVPAGTRPMSDRAREGVFSSLGGRIRGARVLDLFAGTGAMGIEALSRGALTALFVDSASSAVRTIQENLTRTGLRPAGSVRRRDALRFLRGRPGPFELVFADPPYAMEGPAVDRLLAEMAGPGVLHPAGRAVLTRGIRSYMPVIPVHLGLERRLSYGEALVLVFRVQ